MAKPITEQLKDNIDRPERHNINPMNRPARNFDTVAQETKTEEDHAFDELERAIHIKANMQKTISQEKFASNVMSILDETYEMLIDKNHKYGNSALEPKRIFSKADVDEQIKVRIDDKLSRIATASIKEDEDVINDLIGYLILLKISRQS